MAKRPPFLSQERGLVKLRVAQVGAEQYGCRELFSVAALRADCIDRRTWLLDITTDIGIPCLAALSVDADGRGLACGFAARPTLAAAANAALREMCQVELGILLAAGKYRARGDAGLDESDRVHLRRATALSAESCALLHPDGNPARYPTTDSATDIDARLTALGIDVFTLDLTRSDIGVPVVKVVAPGLQPFPSAHVGDRLRRTIASTGGARSAAGIRLI